MHPNQKAKVILRHCDAYDVERIRTIAREGLETLDLRPSGRTLVKPNLVATGDLFRARVHASGVHRGRAPRAERPRRTAVTELAVGRAVRHHGPDARRVTRARGYNPMLARAGVEALLLRRGARRSRSPSRTEGRLRDYLFTPEPVASADFFVNCPKFKAHPWTTVTFSIKAYIGIQDDRHRLIDHDHRLNREDRRPAVHHPAAVHLHRRDHRRARGGCSRRSRSRCT